MIPDRLDIANFAARMLSDKTLRLPELDQWVMGRDERNRILMQLAFRVMGRHFWWEIATFPTGTMRPYLEGAVIAFLSYQIAIDLPYLKE